MPLIAIGDISRKLLRVSPGQWTGIGVFLVVAFLVFGDVRRPLSRRTATIALLALPAIPMIDLIRWGFPTGDDGPDWRLGAAFAGLFAATALMAAWSLALAFRSGLAAWRPNSTELRLRLLLGVLVAMNVVVVLGVPANDAGVYTNLGARRWMETGRIPYGDELLRGAAAPAHGAAATYGPLLYLAHVPFQFLTGAASNPASMNPVDKEYVRPPILATELTCLAFHLVGLWALYRIGKRLRDAPTGLALACLYAASPYVIGLGGDKARACGLSYISHIAPTAVVLLAFLADTRPFVSGTLLAAGAGVLFYPAFLFPLFFGRHFWSGRSGALKFAAGFALVGGLIAAMTIHFTGRLGDRGPVDLFLSSTIEHQEGSGPLEYGSTQFSFWGTHRDLAAFWQSPLFGTGSTFKPTFLLFASLCGASFFFVRRRTDAQFAALVAMLCAAIQLWKTNAAGTYVEWYFPFLLIALFCAAAPTSVDERPGAA